ncbi:hypothetical protein DSAG12_03060 [Promethearchaeum syntrophicum]|uniref:Uncharacterized protein n=1 Tax=Promethearchaeum syntrophicum TaxID=2594042 RepID=A0A5B9DDB2_9ARCH|nr:hypothetical protein [Candidatus Prometheoarchaeum syntrophicum]QEE17228.1 hypothetical protein DSAG12_03060 [Candidatus Prometheoarchaeum syntrophicum]
MFKNKRKEIIGDIYANGDYQSQQLQKENSKNEKKSRRKLFFMILMLGLVIFQIVGLLILKNS